MQTKRKLPILTFSVFLKVFFDELILAVCSEHYWFESLRDSIIKGFPIGTFILWKTKEELRHFKNIGNACLPSPPKGDSVQYVLDLLVISIVC